MGIQNVEQMATTTPPLKKKGGLGVGGERCLCISGQLIQLSKRELTLFRPGESCGIPNRAA